MKNNELVTVCLVTFNSQKYVERCISNIFEQTHNDIELIVIDNASSDDTIKIIEELTEKYTFTYIPLEKNIGFVGGHNLGINKANGKYYMPLNPDIFPCTDYIQHLIKRLSTEKKVGSITGKLLRIEPDTFKETNIIDSTGVYFKKNMRSLDRGAEEVDIGQYEIEEFVFGASGAAPIYKISMIKDISINGDFFQPSFFAYREDVDVAWRAQLKGWQCLYVPYAQAYHVRHNTPEKRKQMSVFINMHSVKNRILMLLENQNWVEKIRRFPFYGYYDLLIIVAVLVKERTSIPALKYIWKHRKKISDVTKQIQDNRTISPKQIDMWFGQITSQRYLYNNKLIGCFLSPDIRDFPGLFAKVQSEVEIFRANNMDISLIMDDSSTKLRKLKKRLPLISKQIENLNARIISTEPDFIYIRMPQAIDFNFILNLKKIKEKNDKIQILMEIPTFPFNNEYNNLYNMPFKVKNYIYTPFLKNIVDKIVTYSNDKEIFGIETINISNGTIFNDIIMKKTAYKSDKLTMIAVASFSKWHGYDRVLEGLKEYYSKDNSFEVELILVGNGDDDTMQVYENFIGKYNLNKYVKMVGLKTGKELTQLFEESDIALDSMGRHRAGIYFNSSLKGKEYLARGLPIVSGVETEMDSYTEFPYYLRVPADDTPVDISSIVTFYKKTVLSNSNPENISKSIRQFGNSVFDMSVTMQPVIQFLKERN